MDENIYKNDKSDEILEKIIDKLIENNQSLRKIDLYLDRINLFGKGRPFKRDFKLLDDEMIKVEELWNIPINVKVNMNKETLFSKINYFLKNIYFKVLFFFLKPLRNRLIANNLASMKALQYLVDSHKKLISDTDKLYGMIKELLEEMNKSIIGISEQQNSISKKRSDSGK